MNRPMKHVAARPDNGNYVMSTLSEDGTTVSLEMRTNYDWEDISIPDTLDQSFGTKVYSVKSKKRIEVAILDWLNSY